jgi:predicted CoA-binding protein
MANTVLKLQLICKEMKKTIIIGATANPSRYAYLAAEMLTEYNHEIVPVGIKSGVVLGKEILPIQSHPFIQDVDTITLYIGPQHQPEHYEYLLSLKPKRVIFNPGTENPEFEKLVEDSGAEAWQACTLVLLRSGQY